MPHQFVKKIPAIRQMKGKGAPMRTIPGVIGAAMEDSYQRSLGGLVVDTKDRGPVPSDLSSPYHTERGAVCVTAPATKMSGEHYGQIPYPGAYFGNLGQRLGVRG
jgi:hypothetical protein